MIVPRGAVLSSAAALVLLGLLTGPLLLQPGSYVIRGDNDTRLNAWIVAWGSHCLAGDPLRLYDTNICFPETNTYAYMDNYLAHSLVGLPAYLMGGARAYRAYNLALIASALLMAACGFLLFRELCGSEAAAIGASLMFLFGLPHLSRISQINLFALPYLLLALYLLQRLCRAPSWKLGLGLGLAFTLQATSGAYPTVYLTFLLIGGALILGWVHRMLLQPAWWRSVLVALAVALILVGPLFYPYVENAQERGLVRSLSGIERLSPNWQSYLVAHSSFYLAAWRAWAPELLRRADTPLFVGVVPLALALLGALAGWRSRRAVVLFYLPVALIALWASTGSAGGLYPLLYRWVPVFKLTRAPARLILVVFLALCALASLGLAWIDSRTKSSRWIWRAAWSALFLIEIWRPLPVVAVADRTTPAIDYLASQSPAAVLAEFPFEAKLQRKYMVASTYHWMELLGGNSAFSTSRYQKRARALASFPEPPALRALAQFQPLWVLVHLERYDPARRAAFERRLAQLAQLEPIGAWGMDRLYRLRSDLPRRGADLTLYTPAPYSASVGFEARSAGASRYHLSLNNVRLRVDRLGPEWHSFSAALPLPAWRRHANRLRWRSDGGVMELRAVRFTAD